MSGSAATIVFSGAPGSRTFTMPISFNSTNGITNNGSNYTYSYAGGSSVTVQVNGGIIQPPPGNTTTTPPIPPPQPAPNISAIATNSITQNSATITFATDISGTTQIEYGLTTSYGIMTAFNSTLTTAHTVALSSLSGGATYHFRVHTQNASGTEAISGDNTFTTLKPIIIDITPPTQVLNLAASNIGQNSANLTFSAPSDPDDPMAASYDIRYSTSTINALNWAKATAVTGEPVPGIPGSAQNYILVGLVPQTTYYVALVSVDAAGNQSALSNVVSFMTAAPVVISTSTSPGSGFSGSSGSSQNSPVPIPAITNFAASSLNGQVSLSWTNPINNASFVRVYIVRKLGVTPPSSPSDGIDIYEGTNQSFVDTNLTNANQYSYAAFVVMPTGLALTSSASISGITPKAVNTQTTVNTNTTSFSTSNSNSTSNSGPTLSAAGAAGVLGQLESLSAQLFTLSNKGRELSFGSRGTDVWALQVILMLDGKGPASAKLLHIGPTGVYGSLTVNAVIEYQKSMGITPAIGSVGAKTRSALEALGNNK